MVDVEESAYDAEPRFMKEPTPPTSPAPPPADVKVEVSSTPPTPCPKFEELRDKLSASLISPDELLEKFRHMELDAIWARENQKKADDKYGEYLTKHIALWDDYNALLRKARFMAQLLADVAAADRKALEQLETEYGATVELPEVTVKMEQLSAEFEAAYPEPMPGVGPATDKPPEGHLGGHFGRSS